MDYDIVMANKKITIIADSCCNLYSKDLSCDKIDFHVVPLTLVLGEEEFIDNEKLDTAAFVQKMNASATCARSACPTPEAFHEIMRKSDNIIVVTLSSKLSATHASAVTAADMIRASNPEKKLFVLDTLSAAAGLDFILFKLRDLIVEGKYSFDELTVKLNEVREQTRVRFLLQDLGNLVKNGRMSKMMGKILTTAKIKLICGDDGQGEIKKYGMALGTKRGLQSLAELAKNAVSAEMPVFITHVHNKEDADFLYNILKNKHGFTNIRVTLMRGVSSLYSADKGIVIAY